MFIYVCVVSRTSARSYLLFKVTEHSFSDKELLALRNFTKAIYRARKKLTNLNALSICYLYHEKKCSQWDFQEKM